jgi:5-methylcytosine-specific restriction endonuclease McrA
MAQKLQSSIQWKNLRRAVLNGATHCHTCLKPFDLGAGPMADRAATLGHILPVAHFPELALEPSNCRPECFGCNRRRGARVRARPKRPAGPTRRGQSRDWFPDRVTSREVVTAGVVPTGPRARSIGGFDGADRPSSQRLAREDEPTWLHPTA